MVGTVMIAGALGDAWAASEFPRIARQRMHSATIMKTGPLDAAIFDETYVQLLTSFAAREGQEKVASWRSAVHFKK